jgi:hypothetical protein
VVVRNGTNLSPPRSFLVCACRACRVCRAFTSPPLSRSHPRPWSGGSTAG